MTHNYMHGGKLQKNGNLSSLGAKHHSAYLEGPAASMQNGFQAGLSASRITEVPKKSRDGRSIDEFEILTKLGHGASGVAFKVRDKRSGEVLAMKQVKIVDSDPGDLANKLNEIAVVKSFRHPYICRQKDYFYDARRKVLCILSEYCDRGDLETYLKNQNSFQMSESRIKRFILEILLGIDYLHSRDVIHRDLKPSNIFLRGKDYTVQIGDFGIACECKTGQTKLEDVGTLLYQSPEILAQTTFEGD